MKKIRTMVCVMLLALAMFSMTGCGSNDKAGKGTTAATTSAQKGDQTTAGEMGNTTDRTEGTANGTTNGANAGTAAGTTAGTDAAGATTGPGVIEGLVDDVERGMDDLTGRNETTAGATTGTTAASERK